MIFGPKKTALLSSEKAIEVIAYLAERISGDGISPEFYQSVARLSGRTRDDFLRRYYLELESQLAAQGDQGWSNAAQIRTKVAERFSLERVAPSSFSMLFQGKMAQLFMLLRIYLEGLWNRAAWGEGERLYVLQEASAGTPLGSMAKIQEEAWTNAYRGFLALPSDQRERAMADAFSRAVERTYSDLVRTHGEGRARIIAEEEARILQQEFSSLEVLAVLLNVLPQGVFAEERIALAPREELAEAISRQTQEMRGKNIALIYEAERLQETIRELRRAKEQAEAMASAQQEFITVVSHQFRTPLSAIRWQADSLFDIAAAHPEIPELVETANVVRERSIFLIGILENIFDLLAIDSGRFVVRAKEDDLGSVIASVCNKFLKEAERRRITLSCAAKDGIVAVFDVSAITRVLSILIMNTLQYTPEGGSVEVHAARNVHAERGTEIVVSVHDTGIGIRPEDRPKIFDKFYRGHNAVLKVPNGVGIALYIAKRIVEFHGGKMWVESKGEGLGATFFFTIPEQGVTPITSPTSEETAPKEETPGFIG